MKTIIKRMSTVTALILYFSVIAEAQNPFWTIPENYVDLNDITNAHLLPVPLDGIAIDDYAGQDAMNGHNGIFYPNGDITFFAVDRKLYDKDGYMMYAMGGTSGEAVTPNGDICIVPDPASCGARFYVFVSNSGTDGAFNYPYCTHLDIEAPGLIYSDKKGAPVFGTMYDSNTLRLDDWVDFEYADGEPISFDGINNRYAFAATPLPSDNNTYLVLVAFGSNIYRLKIDENGMHPINPPLNIDDIFPLTGSQEGHDKITEFEMVPTGNGALWG